jgi:hypothetical protein
MTDVEIREKVGEFLGMKKGNVVSVFANVGRQCTSEIIDDVFDRYRGRASVVFDATVDQHAEQSLIITLA